MPGKRRRQGGVSEVFRGLCRGLIEACNCSAGPIPAAIRGIPRLYAAASLKLLPFHASPYSGPRGAPCRSTFENQECIPRLYAAASLKRQACRFDPASRPRPYSAAYAAASLKRLRQPGRTSGRFRWYSAAYAAASLKQAYGAIDDADTGYALVFRGLCRGLIEAARRPRWPDQRPGSYSAALCRGLIEASKLAVQRSPAPIDGVFRGFMPRPH